MKSNVTRLSERWNMRPPRGVREDKDYRNSGTGHEINLQIEDVLDEINKIPKITLVQFVAVV